MRKKCFLRKYYTYKNSFNLKFYIKFRFYMYRSCKMMLRARISNGISEKLISSGRISRALAASRLALRHSSLFSRKNRIQFPSSPSPPREGERGVIECARTRKRAERARKSCSVFLSWKSWNARERFSERIAALGEAFRFNIYTTISRAGAVVEVVVVGAGYQNISILCNTCRHLPTCDLDPVDIG